MEEGKILNSDINQIRMSGVIAFEPMLKQMTWGPFVAFKLKTVAHSKNRSGPIIVVSYVSCISSDVDVCKFVAECKQGSSVLVDGDLVDDRYRNKILMTEGAKFPDSKQIKVIAISEFTTLVERDTPKKVWKKEAGASNKWKREPGDDHNDVPF